MIWTVITTVLSGVLIFVTGQLVLKLIIEPVQETKKTIAQISHAFIEDGEVIYNLDVQSKEKKTEVSQCLKKLSAQLHSNVFLVPRYRVTASIFGLPTKKKIVAASKELTWLSTGIFSRSDSIYEQISKRHEKICSLLGIYFPAELSWSTE